MPSTTQYWTDLADLHGNDAVTKARADEFPTQLPGIGEVLGDTKLTGATTGRRDFLKFLGFGIGAATLAACETPVIKSIPYVNKPEEIVPGVANWYASTYFDGSDYASVLVKTREAVSYTHLKTGMHHTTNKWASSKATNTSSSQRSSARCRAVRSMTRPLGATAVPRPSGAFRSRPARCNTRGTRPSTHGATSRPPVACASRQRGS